MRISDWSSDVCSSDLKARRGTNVPPDLGAVLEQAGAHHDVEVALVLAEAVEALRQAGARQLLEHREAIALEAGHLAAPERRGGRQRQQVRQEVGDLLHERSEEHTSELQSLMRISYAVLCLK